MVDETREIVKQFVYCLFRGETMTPVLYYIPPSPPCRAVLMLGRMLEIDFDLKPVNVNEGEHLKPDFVQVLTNPFLLPLIIHVLSAIIRHVLFGGNLIPTTDMENYSECCVIISLIIVTVFLSRTSL